MKKYFIDKLAAGNFITADQHREALEWEVSHPFSLHWELRFLLYCGVMLFASGMGIIIYNNIDTIGHTVIIFSIALACAGCFYYCFKHKLPYSHKRIQHDSPWFGYVLLLGCLLFLVLEGYLQYRYSLFGIRYGLATLVPAILFFGLAYIFDHIGVLSMAISALAAFSGFTVSPGWFFTEVINTPALIYAGASLAVILIGMSWLLKHLEIKKHFTFTYYNFGFNLFFICMLSALFTLEYPYIYFILIMSGAFLLTRYAILEKSFYFLLLSVIYGYVAITWAVFQMGMEEIFGMFYFVLSCAGVIWFFVNYKKILHLR